MNGFMKAAAAALFVFASLAHAQTWPQKPVHLVVPFAPGGGTDAVARQFANRLSAMWGQPVIVDNKPGAGGQIGAQFVAAAAPDGLTLLVATSSVAVSAALSKNLPYDPLRDLAPVASLMDSPSLFVVNPQVPAKTIAEFIAYAKANPGKLNYGSTGVGSGPHLAMEQFKMMTQTDIVHVPYNGENPMYAGLFANQIQATILAQQVGGAQVKSGRLRPLAVTSEKRSQFWPDLPGTEESGLKGFEYKPWVGIIAPGKTPAAILQKVNADVQTVLNEDEMKNKILPSYGSEAAPASVDAFHTRYVNDVQEYKKIIRETKIPMLD